MKTNKDRRKHTGKKSKKVLGMLLGMVLVMSAVLALPATKLITEAGYKEDGIEYGVGGSNGTNECKVVSSPDASGDIVILDSYWEVDYSDYGRVVSIDGYAFARNTNITSVVIPSSITQIGELAFASCTGLRVITFQGTMPPNFDSDWLWECNVTIRIPDSVTETQKQAWEDAIVHSNSNCQSFTVQRVTTSGNGQGSNAGNSGTSQTTKGVNGTEGAETDVSGATDQIPEHICQYEWMTVREAGAGVDGLEQYGCRLCGRVESILTIPAADYAVKQLYDKIESAPTKGTVTYDYEKTYTIGDKLLTKLGNRSDVTLVITYQYQGRNYKTTFPAGMDYTQLLEDGEEFYGLLGLNGRCGIVTEICE